MQEAPQQSQQSQPQAPPTIENQIISEEDFIRQYDYDTKVAADAKIDEATGEISIEPQPSVTPTALTDSEALINTEVLISMRESAQAFGLAYYVEGAVAGWQKYQYDAAQKQNLIRAWSRIVQQAGIKVSPWLDVLQAELFATGPLLALAYTARKERVEHEQTKAELLATKKKLSEHEQKAVFQEASRRDVMKQWEIDNDGYFTHSISGNYLKKNPVAKVNERHEKPKLTPENYKLLIKHNTKEKVDRIFNINTSE